MSLRNGSKVWVEDKELAWVAAEVLGYVGKQVQVAAASGKKVKFYLFSFALQILQLLLSVCQRFCGNGFGEFFSPVGFGFTREVTSEGYG